MSVSRDITKLSDWPKLREQIEKAVVGVMGSLPPKRTELQIKVLDEDSAYGYVRRRISYFVDDWERVNAWLFIPDSQEETPAVLCCHDQIPEAKDSVAGLKGDRSLALALRYAERGYITMAPDVITAGDRILSKSKPYETKNFYKDNPKLSIMAKMLADHIQAMEVLNETKDVDPERIGVVGSGMGGLNALMMAAFDKRVQACVAIMPFMRFIDDPDPTRWVSDGDFQCLPALAPFIENRDYPFDWEDILALAAPSPVLLLNPSFESRPGMNQSCDTAVQSALRIYKLLGKSSAVNCQTYEGEGHVSLDALEICDNWLERWL